MTSCRHVLEALSDYLDNYLPAETRRDLEAHLARCRTCHALYDSTSRTLRIVTESESFELPEGLPERVLRRIRGLSERDH